MTHHRIAFILLTLTLLFPGMGAAAAPQEPESLILVTVENGDLPRLAALGAQVYARFHTTQGTRVVTGLRPQQHATLVEAGFVTSVLDTALGTASYYVVYPMTPTPIDWDAYGTALFIDARVTVLRASAADIQRLREDTGARAVLLTLSPQATQSVGGAAFPPVTAPDPVVADMIGEVQQATLHQYTGDLSGEWAVTVDGAPYTIATRHTTSGTPIGKATHFVGEHLAATGLTVEYHQWGSSRYGPNVIGELAGETNPADIVMITAHLDDMPSGSTAPGADDNASGSVAVLVASDILTQHRWSCTLRFALWTGEEQGLLGSEKYAVRSKQRSEAIRGVLNLDMIAWNTPGSAPEIDLHADSNLPLTLELANQFASVVQTYGMALIPEVSGDGTGASDHASFWGQGYTAILGIEDYYPDNHDFNPYYHTANDKLSALDMGYYIQYVKAAVASTVHMAGCRILGPVVTPRYDGGVMELVWPPSAADAGYEVHRSTEPYFSPAGANRLSIINAPFSTPLTWIDPTGGAGDAAVNHFYVVRGMNTKGQGAVSNRIGEFDFTLMPERAG